MERNARGLALSSNLWQKIENRNNARKTLGTQNNTDTSLYRAILAEKTPTNNNTQDIMGGINQGLKGLGTLATTIKNNTDANNAKWGNIGNEMGNFLNGSSLPTGTSDFGNGSSWGNLFNNGYESSTSANALSSPEGFSNLMSGGEGLGSTSGWLGIANGAMNAGKSALGGGSWSDDVPQSFFGIDNKNDSDVMQALKGAGQGAMMGLPFGGPIGAAIGGVLGLGASFLDDI